MIELIKIKKSYNREVLTEITYKFELGKIYVIKGVSGCGKTTLLNILGGIETDYEGVYLYNNQYVGKFKKKEMENWRRNFGYVFQRSLLLSNLSIEDNLLFIQNDKKTINTYAETLGVKDLLKKYPSQLSGGERQRVSLIRALLHNPTVILADEPTASLDRKNSTEIALLFNQLRNEEKIIIIATHEDCFDTIADEIIQLEYGKIHNADISLTEKGTPNFKETSVSTPNKKSGINPFLIMMRFIFKRHKEQYKLVKLLPMSFVLFVLLCCFSIQQNFYHVYMNMLYEKYPIDVFSVNQNEYNILKSELPDLQIYEPYILKDENITGYPLFDERDSSLSINGVIEFGKFPEKDDEILVSHEYAINNFDDSNIEDCIGSVVSIQRVKFKISGVLADINDDNNYYNIVFTNCYYSEFDDNTVFIPYNTIKQYGELQETEEYMVKYEGLYANKNENAYKIIKDIKKYDITPWDRTALDYQYSINAIYKVVIAAVFIAALVATIFIKNIIRLELFYRKKEIGYLQIFGLSKNRIMRLLIAERLTRTIISFGYSIMLFVGVQLIVNAIYGINGAIHFLHMILLLIVAIIFTLINVYIPCNKFLKSSVLSLITE